MRLNKMLCASLLLLLVSCSNTGPAPVQPTAAPANQQPAASAGTIQQTAVSGKAGTIAGTIVDLQGAPIVGIGVYVAVLGRGPNGKVTTISFSVNTSKHGLADKQGHFEIDQVDPGNYALVLFSPGEQVLVPDETGKQGTALQVVVEPEKTTQLGTIKAKRPS